MNKYVGQCTLLLVAAFMSFGCGAQTPGSDSTRSQPDSVYQSPGPQRITRNIIQDRKGNIWIAAFDGVFRYDGQVFTDMTRGISSARFFSVLEDRKGNLWFGSVGAGVYLYDGSTFKNFKTGDGLLNNDVVSIYEDKQGDIWFGMFGGASRYDGKSFQNFVIDGNMMEKDSSGKTFNERPAFEVNDMIEDKTGKLWLATRGNTFIYDGKLFTAVAHDGKPFKNVRCLIRDKKGDIWLGGADGLWHYDGNSFKNFTTNFVGHILEDSNGNIWTSSERTKGSTPGSPTIGNGTAWVLSRYDGKSLSNRKPTVTEIATGSMFFGILEASDGMLLFGGLQGVLRYDGSTILQFNGQR